jgi:hypothetical protein
MTYIDVKFGEVKDALANKAERTDLEHKADKEDMGELRKLVMGGLATGLLTLLTLLVTVMLALVAFSAPGARERVVSAVCSLVGVGQ